MRNRKTKFIKQYLPFKVLIAGCLILLSGSFSNVLSQSKDDFPVPETYKTEGIPAIKNSEVENLFYDPASIRSNLIWDADRKNRKMLVTDETNNVYLLDSPMSKPVKLIDKIIPQSVKIRPNGESFAYNSDHEDEDNYSLYLYDFKEKTSKKLVPLTGRDESIDSFIWSKNGDSLFYMRVDYDAKVSHLCRYNFVNEKCYPDDLRGIWSVQDNNDNQILLKYSKASSMHYLYIYDTQANKLNPIDENGDYDKGFFNGNSVLWVTQGNSNCKKNPCVLSKNFDTNKLSQVKLPKNLLNINDIKLSPGGNNLLIKETKDGIDRLRIFRIKLNRIIREIPSFLSDSSVIWNNRWISDNEIAYTLENVSKPASIQSFSVDTKSFTDWTKARLPAQLENKVTLPEAFKWRSFDQKAITGFIVRPIMNEKKSPVLINVHGGPQTIDTPVFNSQDVRFASNLGMTIIHTNIRGSSGFGNEFMDADNKEKRGDAVKDIQSLLDWIGKQPELDSNQIYLRGGSYGGFYCAFNSFAGALEN